MTKNLILGTGTNYKYEDLQNFVVSLKRIHFDGEVVILVSSGIDEYTKTKLQADGVHLIYAGDNYLKFSKRYANSRLWKVHYPIHKLIFSLLNKRKDNLRSLNNYVKRFHLISGSRYCFYHDFLAANIARFDNVLLTDVRDVVFQSDPFKDLHVDQALKFYCEDKSIGDSFYTAYWIKHAFGAKALAQIKDHTSICSGTTMGSAGNILFYLEQMIRTQARITAGLTGLGGFDQGVHNYLIYNNYFPNSTVLTNIEGEVATLSDPRSVSLNTEQELTDSIGRVIPVIHQYDRMPELKFKAIAR
ncbi:hypothetical protein [Mucilaginibacter myungsuensis]|uniref:Uncharacterized protein n=1 Tax=Mucilaginibacter myungsuensis TaxID=649104 RepID=A0A929PWK0_9SPHI|nr:hypothetical protein [Mucilaginibacter myungsuensis]MBE9662913.1 hypothetical protein [Mucilaginibacter myungsuensis]MDN3598533.1 hypothetical protein [Mucilaginibacter myungsuensis]